MHASIHTYINTCIYAYIRTYIHIYVHRYIAFLQKDWRILNQGEIVTMHAYSNWHLEKFSSPRSLARYKKACKWKLSIGICLSLFGLHTFSRGISCTKFCPWYVAFSSTAKCVAVYDRAFSIPHAHNLSIVSSFRCKRCGVSELCSWERDLVIFSYRPWKHRMIPSLL